MPSIRLDNVLSVNQPRLDQDIRAVSPHFTGLSTGKSLVLHFLDGVTQEEQDMAVTIARTHDPLQLSPDQQEEQARRQKLALLRENYQDVEVDPAAYSSEKVIIQTLAQKLAWLEQEVLNLGGGHDV